MYHIGVGSDVVCSTLKAMLEPRLVERTTDVSTLFHLDQLRISTIINAERQFV